MDLARECSSWSGKLHFRLIILVQGKASFHLHLWLFILKQVMDVFNCHQQHQISLFECKPIQKLFACKEYGKVHLFESSYKNKLVSKFFKFCCLFLFFLFAGLFMVIINSCWPLSGYTNAPAARRLQISNLKMFDPTIKCASALHTSSASVENLVQHNFHNENR